MNSPFLCLIAGLTSLALLVSACGDAVTTAVPTAGATALSSPSAIQIQQPTEPAVQPIEPAEQPTETAAQPGPTGVSEALPVLPTPDCAGLFPTPPDAEGPYFLDNTPQRDSLVEPGMSGERLIVSGYVLTVDCLPLASVRLEFWQADANGQYDLQGYRLRGHLFTDANGYYRLETILPAIYGGRPRHIHVKVLLPSGGGLTTQLYFPGDSPLPALTVALTQNAAVMQAIFHFVLPTQ
jgi:protocatechuate 3,4-dioxygenase beta subunit